MLQHWTPEHILALAPNARAAQAGRQLATPHLWSSRGTTAEVAWGECQGRADTPYQIRIDLTRPVFHCTCLSRQSPCKHSLGLLLMLAEAQDAGLEATPPAWVTAELPRRTRRGSVRPPSAHRVAQRHATVRAGLVGLKRWLRDLVHQGLATVLDKPASFWQQPAARLVDAQAPGLARLVRACAQDVASGADDWQARVVQRLGSLYLAVTGYARFDTLAPGAQADLRTFLGWPQRREEALATPGQRDSWLIIGQHQEQEGKLTTQRTWLWGLQGAQAALVLEFIHGHAPLDPSLRPGTQVDADLVFYPSAFPLRALVKTCYAPASPLTTWGGTPHLQTALQHYAMALARNPWLSQYPFVLQDVTVERQTAARWIVRDGSGHTLPLVTGFPYGWALLALSRHQAFGLCGEWDGEALRPLGIWTGEYFIDCHTLVPVATPQEGRDSLPPPSPVWQELVTAACVGTSRRPAPLSLVTPAGGTPSPQPGAADPQGSLLGAVATLTLSQRAGRVLTCALPYDPWPDDREVLPRCRAGAGKHLGLMLSGSCREVLPEWLEALAATRQRVPEEHLPALLELGRTHPDLRPALQPVLGTCGRWLATRHPDWAYATEPAPVSTRPSPCRIQRVLARLTPVLHYTPDTSVEVTLPQTCDRAMQRESMTPGNPTAWFQQMLAMVPPAHWCQAWDTTPATLLRLATQHVWSQPFADYHQQYPLVAGWLQATLLYRDAPWAEALVPYVPLRTTTLLKVLPQEHRERLVMPWLQEPDTRPKILWKAVVGLEACQHAWSPTFARAVLTWLRTVSATLGPFMAFSADLQNTWLPQAGRFLPLDCHDEARTGWPTETPHWGWWAPALATCLRLLQFRRAMYEELAR